jgi:two-component system sensor histidine kinase KdpD
LVMAVGHAVPRGVSKAGNKAGIRWRAYGIALLACGATAALALPLSEYFDLANIVMLFLLTVVLVAVKFGRGPAVMAAFLSVALFDFFLVPPRLSFAVNDIQYLLTFAVMLTVALIIGQLAAGLKQQADLASLRERRTLALYEMSRELAGALQSGQVVEIARRFLHDVLHAKARVLLIGRDGELILAPDDAGSIQALDLQMANAALTNGACADLDAESTVGYVPLKAPARVRGVLAVAFEGRSSAALSEHHELLEAVASLAAIAIERLHYVEVANQAELQMVSERLRSSILSAVSHDLRTPLTALVGLADALAVGRPPLAGPQRESAEAIRNQAIRLSGLVANLLDMARLNAGEVKLRKEWQPLEEVIGASIKSLERNLTGHPVSVRLAADLPLLQFDAVLMERVFCNLIENAAKYSAVGTAIDIGARCIDAKVEISVCDRGHGIPRGHAEQIFEMFVRGTRESATPGVGLGLAICRAIVEAHGGSISAANRSPSGACFLFTLPTGTPPVIEAEVTATGALHD